MEPVDVQKISKYHMYNGVKYPWQVPLSCLQMMESFEIREDDVWVLTYSKSGTTWISDIVNKILVNSGIRQEDPYVDCAPYVEFQLYSRPNHEMLVEASSPRVIGSHLLPQALPPQIFSKKPKVIYVARNPKDIVASSLYHYKIIKCDTEYDSIQKIMDAIMSGSIVYGEWHTHVLHWWDKRNDDNVLFLKYEDMKKDLQSTVHAVNQFLGYDLGTESICKITEETTIEATRQREIKPRDPRLKAFNLDTKKSPFVRKGVVGDWKNHFTVAQNEEFDKWYKEVMKETDLTFNFEA